MEKFLHMRSVRQIMCTIFDVLLHFMLFCCKISHLCDLRCFVAKSVMSPFFVLWRGEKLSQKLCLWRKNDKYEVWKKLVGLQYFRLLRWWSHFCIKHDAYFPPFVQMSARPYNAHGTVYRTISTCCIIAIANNNMAAAVELGELGEVPANGKSIDCSCTLLQLSLLQCYFTILLSLPF